MQQPQVLIAGAGPTGLVCALRLARRGVPFRIISKAAGPGTQSRAVGVHARTLELYDQLGLADRMVAAGVKVDRVTLREHGVDAAEFRLESAGHQLSPHPYMLAYPQDEHERMLIEELGTLGVTVDWETELVALRQDDAGVAATLRQGGREHSARFDYAVGADGAHSVVRHQLGVGFEGGAYDQLFYVADVELEGGFQREMVINLGAEGFVLLMPVRSRGAQRLIGVAPHGTPANASFEDVRPLAESLSGVTVRAVNWFSTYHVSHRVADRFRVGRCFLAGDAGHIHSPAGGQGMNTGIGDAVNLAWKLADVLQGRAGSQLLDTYEPERIGFARSLVATTDRAFRSIVAENAAGRALRTIIAPHAMGFLTGFSAVRRGLFNLVSQVRIAYGDSPLSHGRAGDVEGGDRLPWTGPGAADNFAPLRALDWQVHLHGTLDDAFGTACEALGLVVHAWPWSDAAQHAGYARDAATLVRPDGYVALALPRQDPAALRRYVEFVRH